MASDWHIFTLLSDEMECKAPMLKIVMFFPGETRGHKINRDAPTIESQKGGTSVPDFYSRFFKNSKCLINFMLNI